MLWRRIMNKESKTGFLNVARSTFPMFFTIPPHIFFTKITFYFILLDFVNLCMHFLKIQSMCVCIYDCLSTVIETLLNQHKQNKSTVSRVVELGWYLVFTWCIQKAKKEVNRWAGQETASYCVGLDLRNKELGIEFISVFHGPFNRSSYLLHFKKIYSAFHQLTANLNTFTSFKVLNTVLVGLL